MLIHFICVLSLTLYHMPSLKTYIPYCQAQYRHIPQKKGFKLKKVIVLHRHGDRMPLKTYGKEKGVCVRCDVRRRASRMNVDWAKDRNEPWYDDRTDTYSMQKCRISKCTDGTLTVKGYNQMRRLGRFIKDEYIPRLGHVRLTDINFRATAVKRTHSSLSGVVSGMFEEDRMNVREEEVNAFSSWMENDGEDIGPDDDSPLNADGIQEREDTAYYDNGEYTSKTSKLIDDKVSEGPESTHKTEPRVKKLKKIKRENFGKTFTLKIPPISKDTLVGYKTCPKLTHILTLTTKKAFSNVKNQTDLQNITDNYLCSMCADIQLDCEKLSCNISEVYDVVTANFKTWTYQSILLLNHLEVLEFLFGKFAIDLGLLLEDNSKLSVLSLHDNSLSYVLAGLGTRVIERPPLASAIFIEVWENKGDKYVRVLFNQFVCLTNIDSSTNIPFDKLVRYLNAVKATDASLSEACTSL
ncbi:Lysosomal & prostatic acid phosphatase [Trachipleistophora hominis]|uniref:Lysosomal & prostatic acid phosphatase n=1 Tax=Trachipleistophora hominis TaxID=72359 RepID=L7JVF2_TRAHO|nr:Lysosomal & prostatic acid phosphatase [Trachipleistophora hominis]